MNNPFNSPEAAFEITGADPACALDRPKPAAVIGPLGEPLTLDSLPPRNCKRWVPRRKAEVVAAVGGGLLTINEACERYNLTLEEFVSWQRAVVRAGIPGLRAQQTQHYRDLCNRLLGR